MKYIGKKVLHKLKYGEGVIVSEDSKGHIYVKFHSEEKEKLFPVPQCFVSHLQLLDTDAEVLEEVKKDVHDFEEKEKSTAVIKKTKMASFIMESKVGSSTGVLSAIHVPAYHSVAEFCAIQKHLLSSEIDFLKKHGGKHIKLMNGKLVEKKQLYYIYSFESDSELGYPDNTQITIWPPDDHSGINGIIINCEEFTVIIATLKMLSGSLGVIEFSSEPWRLLAFLQIRMEEIEIHPSPIVKALVCDGKNHIDISSAITKGQDNASHMSISQPITFVWGPPGTGKTETLANIALIHLQKKYRVLMLSYSNVSVDGAVWRVFEKAKHLPHGSIVRYGYPKDKSLLHHDYLTAYNLTLRNHPDLLQERKQLLIAKKKAPKDSKLYVEIGKRLNDIRKLLSKEEKQIVMNAPFVATTVSKAIADSLLYEGQFDTVIFDEASMAYIPQVVFSASLAKKHFICMGDFSQLPPIVQSDSSNALNIDIFRHCGIVDAVESGYAHRWLCMLDTQYRMHPTIAEFASITMYHKLLKSGKGMAEKRKAIKDSEPFSKSALHLVDLSGMMSVCTKTGDQSRINVLSAMISMGLAINASKKNEVGIIAPYNAQSRLLHAMTRDISENYPGNNPISCATVHQFQGSEKDIIIYDAADCFKMPYPGTLLTSTTNNYANRLYNVAVTRAKGKMISVVNADYMKTKKLSKNLIFRKMINSLSSIGMSSKGEDVLKAVDNKILRCFHETDAWTTFFEDIKSAKKVVHIDIPGGAKAGKEYAKALSEALISAKKKGVKVIVRAENPFSIPDEIKDLAIKNKYVTDSIAMIDKKIVWYGMPPSKAEFISEGLSIPTKYRPVMRFTGNYFAQALNGFLEMSHTVDEADVPTVETTEASTYSTFAAYVAGEVKCSVCKGKMKLKKSKKGKFFLGCSDYPACSHTELAQVSMVEDYFYFNNDDGKHCPIDNTSLEAKMGPFGIYVCCCNGLEKHFYKLDEV